MNFSEFAQNEMKKSLISSRLLLLQTTTERGERLVRLPLALRPLQMPAGLRPAAHARPGPSRRFELPI